MNILFTVIGSHGDVNPYLALALEMKARGHRIVFCTQESFKEKIEHFDLRFVSHPPSLAQVGPEQVWIEKAFDSTKGSEFIIREMVLPFLSEQAKILEPLVIQSDLIVGHIFSFAVPPLAEKYNKKWILLILQPSALLSAYDKSELPGLKTFLPFLNLHPVIRKSFYWLIKQVSQSWFKPVQNLRKSLSLLPNTKHPMFEAASPYLNLAMFSKSFAAPQKDWPSPIVQVGFPLFDSDKKEMSLSIGSDFLTSGQKPWVFTLGSAAVFMGKKFFDVASRVASERKQKTLLILGKPEAGNHLIIEESKIYRTSAYEPYSLVFPHARAVIHQGGIGTTSQALHAGVPQIVVPFSHDQPDNARRIVDFGLGARIDYDQFDSKSLHQALDFIEENETSLNYNAQQFAGTLEKNAIMKAADALESALLR